MKNALGAQHLGRFFLKPNKFKKGLHFFNPQRTHINFHHFN